MTDDTTPAAAATPPETAGPASATGPTAPASPAGPAFPASSTGPAFTATSTGGTFTASSTAPTFTATAPPAAAATPLPETSRRRSPAQFGTIVWGMLLLALCGFVALAQFGPGVDADRYLWAFIGVIAAGVALVAVGIAAAFRR